MIARKDNAREILEMIYGSQNLLFQHVEAKLSHRNIDLIYITEGENSFCEILYFFRGALPIIPGGKTNHRKVRAKNEIKSGLEIGKVRDLANVINPH